MSDAQRKNRRASSRHEDEPAAKRKGRPKKADQTSQAPSTAMSRVQARRMVAENPNLQYTGDDLDAYYRELVSWHVDGPWDPEDDDAIDEEWEQSPQKANSKFTPSQHSSFLTMFKVCLRLFKSTPVAIFSPYHSLRYCSLAPNGYGNEWIYTRPFCDSFTDIMEHPFWESNTDLLATALQWTVICRLDDRRLWSGRLDKPCPALDSVYAEVQRCHEQKVELSCSYHEMHVSERERILERGESPGEWSDLFYQIGELASEHTATKPKPAFTELLGLKVLPVTIHDLKLLTDALDSTDLRPEWNYSVDEATKGWSAEVSGQDLPTMKKLPLVFEIAWKSVFRYVRLVKRKLASDSSPPLGDDEDQDSQGSVHPRDDEDQDLQGSIHTSDGQDNESEPEIAHRPRTLRRRQVVDDDYDREDEFIPHSSPGINHEGTGEDDFMDCHLELDFGLDLPPDDAAQSTSGADVLLAHGPTLSSRQSLRPSEPPVHGSFHEEQMSTEISSLKEENAKLYKLVQEGQKQQMELILNMKEEQNQQMLDMRNEQNQQMLDMKEQLQSMQSELTQLRKTKEAPNQADVEQSHPERPSLPEPTVIAPGAATRSPELGTSP
ncbi:uncharacterized protein FFUJ_09036 [Fusarium fujikuroi IMI 58289]|uniref:Uncharacterized protein n=1 Tax=Gibberella fujikuroi (strain CBS 195.34 / IMI 58289 / NRRL A-6831) TaxID=1279085 RepID=S0EAZ4_GIBF5|nr:uncharacterized protein FFUJ_09036 [Fusarium fujikuroi IMI 58289]KLP21990.1 uncharacterized protein LW94_7138 [Fusarium fujikuroi]CCT70937.1 uncharacterized protein FFUJ_09036 [Fusarium fujikuroi IMI 58289]SCO02638.1 uncharacterized protein FFM5_07919 [Fusarium fujikuroi]SCO52998.1 uncharacterized protein FFMR_11317 [Fusarium fujikuroi]